MIVSYAVCQRDEAIAVSTLEWALTLDGKLPYDAILSVGDGVDAEPVHRAMEKLFRSVTEINSYAPNQWPQGKNMTFQNLVRYLDAKRSAESFFWWEPDAIPLRKGWLAEIEREHVAGGKAFTGYVHDALKSMECVGVYPPNFMQYSPTNGMLCRAAPWDRCAALEIAGHVHRINPLMQFVHDVDGLPPTFPKDTNLLKDGAVLFHACKNGTLIEHLSKGKIRRTIERFFSKPEAVKQAEPIVVVFPVCKKDAHLAVHHAKWLRHMGQKLSHRALIASDFETPAALVNELHSELSTTFREVGRFLYPQSPNDQWPMPANWAFKQVAEYMATGTAPWLWLESDACATRVDWLERIQREYDAAQKPFMGPVVPGHGHCNGVAVYPHDTSVRIPKALSQVGVAWDFAAKSEMNGSCHDANGLFWHAWGVVGGKVHPTLGEAPDFSDRTICKQLPQEAVIAHRAKTPALIDHLWRERDAKVR